MSWTMRTALPAVETVATVAVSHSRESLTVSGVSGVSVHPLGDVHVTRSMAVRLGGDRQLPVESVAWHVRRCRRRETV
mgnify:CR=1 FL=1